MTLRRETRQAWGAQRPRNRRYVTKTDAALGGVVVHYPGVTGSMRHLRHDQHQALLRDWQRQHMARGSNDLEYGSLICPCGVWMEGRTEFDNWLVRVGSNGTQAANDRHTSIQLMIGAADQPTPDEKAWLAEAIATLRSHGWGPDVAGHRDFVATACPGDPITAALPEIQAMADQWKDTDMPLTDADVERIAQAVAARVNRVLGDYNAEGEPIGPNKDDPQLGAVYIRQIKKLVKKLGA